MVRCADSFDLDITLHTLNLYTEALVSPVHDDQLFAFEVKFVAEFATRHEDITCAFVHYVIFEVLVGEYLITLFTSEFLLVEKPHHKSVDFLKALLFRAIRTFLAFKIESRQATLFPPSDQTIFAIQIRALAAFLRVLHHIVADAAPEGLLEISRCHVWCQDHTFIGSEVLLDLLAE